MFFFTLSKIYIYRNCCCNSNKMAGSHNLFTSRGHKKQTTISTYDGGEISVNLPFYYVKLKFEHYD